MDKNKAKLFMKILLKMKIMTNKKSKNNNENKNKKSHKKLIYANLQMNGETLRKDRKVHKTNLKMINLNKQKETP